MSQTTTHCPRCGVVLNLPDGVSGKRLRCPKCGERFLMAGVEEDTPAPPSSPQGSKKPPHRPASSLLLTESGERNDIPLGDHDLRDTFAPADLLAEDEPPPPPKRKSSPQVPVDGPANAGLLFQDDVPTRPRRPGAEARHQHRRCPSCNSVVPAGMSLCNRCGLDLETGLRHVMDELLDEPIPTIKQASLPIVFLVLGGLTFMASLTASIFALVIAQRPEASQFGFICLALIGAFGMYASVQFLRGSSMKLLAVALMLAAIIDVLGMIFLPIYQASRDREGMRSQISITDVMEDRVTIPSMPQLLEPHMNTIYAGIVILLVIAAALYYLSQPATRDKFNRGVL